MEGPNFPLIESALPNLPPCDQCPKLPKLSASICSFLSINQSSATIRTSRLLFCSRVVDNQWAIEPTCNLFKLVVSIYQKYQHPSRRIGSKTSHPVEWRAASSSTVHLIDVPNTMPVDCCGLIQIITTSTSVSSLTAVISGPGVLPLKSQSRGFQLAVKKCGWGSATS